MKDEGINFEGGFCSAPSQEKLAEGNAKALNRPGRGGMLPHNQLDYRMQKSSPCKQAVT
jgi:hypothetical protein